MSAFSGRPQYDDPLSEEGEAVADWDVAFAYCRLAAPSGGGVATMQQHSCGGALGGGSLARGSMAETLDLSLPILDSETSGESTGPLCSAAAEVLRSVPAGHDRQPFALAAPPSAHRSQKHDERVKGPSSRRAPGGFNSSSVEYNESPRFWSPFGNFGKTATEGSSSYDCELENSDTPCVIPFPSTFRLERTNFVVTAPSPGKPLFGEFLLDALRSALSGAGVDVLDFKPAHCVLECSYHVGSAFIGLFVRVFQAPDHASGELIDTGTGDDQQQTPFLVEVQHRDGDRLLFKFLFREIMREFKNQEGVSLAGTFRYRQRPYPSMGEGLALESASMGPSRNSIRLNAEREDFMKAAGNNHVAGARSMLAKGDAIGSGSGVSPLPEPAGMAGTLTPVELDDDMLDHVMMLADMQRGEYVDVQANAATAVAGLTADPYTREQLSQDLAAASARLLVETQHRPARRQAAVVVANLSTTPQLREAPLSSDPAVSSDMLRTLMDILRKFMRPIEWPRSKSSRSGLTISKFVMWLAMLGMVDATKVRSRGGNMDDDCGEPSLGDLAWRGIAYSLMWLGVTTSAAVMGWVKRACARRYLRYCVEQRVRSSLVGGLVTDEEQGGELYNEPYGPIRGTGSLVHPAYLQSCVEQRMRSLVGGLVTDEQGWELYNEPYGPIRGTGSFFHPAQGTHPRDHFGAPATRSFPHATAAGGAHGTGPIGHVGAAAIRPSPNAAAAAAAAAAGGGGAHGTGPIGHFGAPAMWPSPNAAAAAAAAGGGAPTAPVLSAMLQRRPIRPPPNAAAAAGGAHGTGPVDHVGAAATRPPPNAAAAAGGAHGTGPVGHVGAAATRPPPNATAAAGGGGYDRGRGEGLGTRRAVGKQRRTLV